MNTIRAVGRRKPCLFRGLAARRARGIVARRGGNRGWFPAAAATSAKARLAVRSQFSEIVDEDRKQFVLRGNTQLREQVSLVHHHGAGGDIEKAGDRVGGMAAQQKLTDLALAVC